MGITTATTKAVEQSTYVITVAFKDEEGDAVVPDSPVLWTLVTKAGEVVNNREQQEIAAASSVNIVLQGDDLNILFGADEEDRSLVVETTYSSSLGSNLPIKEQFDFKVINLKYIQ